MTDVEEIEALIKHLLYLEKCEGVDISEIRAMLRDFVEKNKK